MPYGKCRLDMRGAVLVGCEELVVPVGGVLRLWKHLFEFGGDDFGNVWR